MRKKDERRKRAIGRFNDNLVSLDKQLTDIRRQISKGSLTTYVLESLHRTEKWTLEKIEETKDCLKNTERNLGS